MIDRELVEKRLAFIETCLRDLRALARIEDLATDVREERFVEHTLQLAIQAALDIASHVVSEERMGEPLTNRDLFDRLTRGGWMSADLGTRISNMAGFRNVIVHNYADVDLDIVVDVVTNHLGDLDEFVLVIRASLSDRSLM